MISNTSKILKNDSLYSYDEIKDIIRLIRYYLYNRGAKHGAQAIQKEMDNLDIRPVTSLSLSCRHFTDRFWLTVFALSAANSGR